VFSFFIGGGLMKGNELIGWFVSKRVVFEKEPARALRINLLAMLIFTITYIFVFNYVFFILIFGNPFSYLFGKGGILTMFIMFAVTAIIIATIYSIQFFKSWREVAINEERLKREAVELQYTALKNQVNPHFLFNSLNTLSSLVYQNQETAVKFIKQLSDVYRYVLEHKDNELVKVGEEINFVEKYVYLQKIRFGDNLKIEIDVPDISSSVVAPLSLQMLVENAIKHNITSSDKPLTIRVFCEDGYIIVKNNLQRKSIVKDSGGIGLGNIRSRYKFLTDKEFLVEETNDEFIVKIPVVEKNN
jgi:LytS/YehU family sensor histidine kinase